MSKNKLVRDQVFIDEHLLSTLASKDIKGTFFAKSQEFYNQVKDKPMNTLSKKQQNWLYDLSAILQKKAMTQHSPVQPQKEPSLWEKLMGLFKG